LKPHLSTRKRFFLLLLGTLLLTASAIWLVRRWSAVRILDEEGIVCVWMRYSPGKVDVLRGDQSRWLRLLPNARPFDVRIEHPLRDGPKLAWALEACGGTDSVSLGGMMRNDAALPGWTAFLHALGRQEKMKILELWFPQPSEIGPILRQFPNLISLSLRNVDCTAVDFPLLNSLQSLTLSGSKISDQGLAALLRSPVLNEIYLDHGSLTPAGLMQLSQAKALVILWLSQMKLTPQEEREFRAGLARLPSLKQLKLEPYVDPAAFGAAPIETPATENEIPAIPGLGSSEEKPPAAVK
jgi:hypothetical protein